MMVASKILGVSASALGKALTTQVNRVLITADDWYHKKDFVSLSPELNSGARSPRRRSAYFRTHR